MGKVRTSSSPLLPDALAVTVDTSDPAALADAIATAVSRYGRIDVIFNNTGISGEQQILHEMTLENPRASAIGPFDSPFLTL